MDVVHHLEPFMSLRLEAITHAAIDDSVRSLSSRHPRQAQILHETLTMVLRDAQKRGQRISMQALTVKRPKSIPAKPQFLTRAEVERLAGVSTQPHLIRFAAYTGLRQGEVFALRDADVDLARRVITVTHTAYNGEIGVTKTPAARRTLPLGRNVAGVLSDQLATRPPSTYVFPAPKGGLWNRDNFNSRVLQPATRASGLAGVTFHDLRHTFAALAIQGGGKGGTDAKVLQELMGHASFAVTMNTYGHLYDADKRAAVDELDALIGN
jgi:integrase